MLLFAHLGLTLASARLVGGWMSWNPSLPFIALGSLLPDIIDKPLGWMIYGTPGMGRIYAHTLLFLLLLSAFAFFTRSRSGASIAGGVTAHLILDGMWRSPVTLLWPLMGDFPVHADVSASGYLQMLIAGLSNPWISVPEAAGLVYLVYLARSIGPEGLAAMRVERDNLKRRLNRG